MMVRIALPTSVQKSLSEVVVTRLLSADCPVVVPGADVGVPPTATAAAGAPVPLDGVWIEPEDTRTSELPTRRPAR